MGLAKELNEIAEYVHKKRFINNITPHHYTGPTFGPSTTVFKGGEMGEYSSELQDVINGEGPWLELLDNSKLRQRYLNYMHKQSNGDSPSS